MDDEKYCTITMIVQYACGCREAVRTGVWLPASLAGLKRTPENDQKVIDYIVDTYKVEGYRCRKKHRTKPRDFLKILELM